ncbi:EAL domain-containing protein [Demequina sp. TTPB684]|uniref:EAL domain-containing protein n=1 Tax=unclassified Demequina TaxID=2620311 RepID=UPI001CF11929|nr:MULTISPECIES: EAL domain-containing protein [unclassified Demequina]MCB2413500.1 EAL domain-containing protein [Demequina sp. TTPB684]UPU87180.1 EAL domain-containing protein [Demequina sp. TMPB413]
MTIHAHTHATDARWTQLIDDAIAGRGVECHFQPIIDLDQRVVVGYEALARFSHPDAEGVGPDVWFARAKARGLQPELEAVVLRKALSRRSEMPRETFLAVNIEPDSLRHPLVRDIFSEMSDLTGLVLEITEHSSWEWADLEPSINAARAKGALIAVDDAGAGYSGLQQILELRPSILKLDRAIVHGVATDEAKVALVEMIGLFASRVDAWVVAEGIESLADAKRLADMRVPLAQGFLFAKPSPGFTDIDPEISAQLAAFSDQAGDTMHRLIQAVPTIPVEQSTAHAWSHVESHWVVVVDRDRRPHGLVNPAAAIAGELISTLTVNVNCRPAEVAQRISTARSEPGAPIIITDDSGHFMGIVTLRRLLGKLSALAG